MLLRSAQGGYGDRKAKFSRMRFVVFNAGRINYVPMFWFQRKGHKQEFGDIPLIVNFGSEISAKTPPDRDYEFVLFRVGTYKMIFPDALLLPPQELVLGYRVYRVRGIDIHLKLDLRTAFLPDRPISSLKPRCKLDFVIWK